MEKKFFKRVLDKVINQGKEIAENTVNDFIEQSATTIKDAASEKVHQFTDGFLGKKTQSKVEPHFFENINFSEDKIANDVSEVAYLDGDKFENNLLIKLSKIAPGLAAGNPAEVANVLNNLISMAGEVSKFTEVQKTKRKEIEAKRDVIVNNIQFQKEIILIYLEKSFDARKENFAKLFSIVDDAISKDNMQQLALSLDSINKLAASSPFKALSTIESTQNALTDKNHIWDF